MPKRMTGCLLGRRLNNVSRIRLTSALLVALGMGGALSAPDVVASNSTPSNTVTAPLEYGETSYSAINWNVSLTTQTTPFKKEPNVSGKIVRGLLKFRGDSSNSVPFLWARDARKVYLDLNRNQDLTDDPAGTFSARETSPSSYQTFTNVHLSFTTAAGQSRILADISFYSYGSRSSCSLAVRSIWQGKAELHGRDWQVGIIPDGLYQLDLFNKGRLLLRPWGDRNRPFNVYDGSLETIRCSRKLFIDGHAYELELVSAHQESNTTASLKFTEKPVALGELKITGKYIQRLVLSGGPYVTVLDQPAAAVRVPVGSYDPPDVFLEQSGTKAYCSSDRAQSHKRISVTDKTPVALAAGGPLTNSVVIARNGRNLNLNYRLVGVGGSTFQLANRNYSKPPQFAVFRDGKEIASGNFQYG